VSGIERCEHRTPGPHGARCRLRWGHDGEHAPELDDVTAAPPALGRKLDAGKPRFDLIPTAALHGLASCLAYGAAKYSDDNWSQVPGAPRRYYAALLRHVEAWRAGEQRDAESGLHHLDHALACLVFLRALDVGQVGTTPGAPEFRPEVA
jgi:hypothetical protein